MRISPYSPTAIVAVEFFSVKRETNVTIGFTLSSSPADNSTAPADWSCAVGRLACFGLHLGAGSSGLLGPFRRDLEFRNGHAQSKDTGLAYIGVA